MLDPQWQSLLKGEKKALEKIYSQHVDMLYAYGCQLISRHDLVEDAIQDLFVYIWNKRTTLSGVTSVKGYLLVSFKRLLIRKKEQEIKKVGQSSIDDKPFLLELVDQSDGPTSYSEEKRQKLKEAIINLTDRQREVIYLRFESGLEYKDIASHLGMNYQSVRNLLHRAVKKLRDEMILFWPLNALWINLFHA